MNTPKKHITLGAIDFADIFSKYYKSLCVFAISYTQDKSAAEDIVEESFIKLWENRHRIRNERAIYSWLCATTRNHALNLLQAAKRAAGKKETAIQSLAGVDTNDQLEKMMHAELVTELHRLIHELPSQCSKVLTNLYIHDKSVAETAAELNLSVNTIKSHKARGIDLLRHKLRPLLLALLLSY